MSKLPLPPSAAGLRQGTLEGVQVWEGREYVFRGHYRGHFVIGYRVNVMRSATGEAAGELAGEVTYSPQASEETIRSGLVTLLRDRLRVGDGISGAG
jgi:hypothetical protein